MKTLKRGDSSRHRGARRGHAALATRGRRRPLAVTAPALPADGDDAALALPPMFEITPADVTEALEGAIDDWAGIDDWPDRVDEPAERRSWH